MSGVGNQLVAMLIALAGLAVGASAMYASSARPAAGHLGAEDLRRFVDRAVQEGGRTGDGATLVFEPSATGTFVRLYPHRPYGPTAGVAADPTDTMQLERNVSLTFNGVPAPYALFVDPDGRLEPAAWSPGQGAIVAPGCSAPIMIALKAGASGGSTVSATLTVGCDGSVP